MEVPDPAAGTAFPAFGGQFVPVTGGSRLDVIFTLFTVGGEGMEKSAEFDALLGGLDWFDPHRFVFTRIDDIRDTESGVFSVTALKLSAMPYDAAAEAEVVLKEADETRSTPSSRFPRMEAQSISWSSPSNPRKIGAFRRRSRRAS